MNGRRIGVVAAGVVAVTVLAGCGGGVKYAGSKVDSEVTFVDQIEQRFREDADRSRANIGTGAHCWLLKDKDSGELDSVAACGPVRHLGVAEGGVWDLYRFNGSVDGKQVEIDGVTLDKTAAELPRDREPYRGDDAKIPERADVLAPPDAPPAKAAMARIVPDAKVENVAKPPKSQLILPGATVQATEVGEVRFLPGDEQSPLYRAADGEEFRAVKVKIAADPDAPKGSVGTAPAYVVKAGSQQTAIDLGKDPKATDGETVVVSVPRGQDADLVVTVAGVGQSLSVRTGDRTSTTAAAYYRQNTKVSVNKQFPSQHVTVGQFQLGHQITFTDATVSPFDSDKGWAPAGKVWLELGFSGAGTDTIGGARGVYGWTANTTGQLTVTDDKRRRIPVTVPASLTGEGEPDGVIAVQLAEDAQWIDVSYGPLGRFAQKKAIYRLKPASGSYAFKRIGFRVTVPQ